MNEITTQESNLKGQKPVLVIGATGYVGNRLVPRLLDAGYRVRASARSLDKLRNRAWSNHPNLEVVEADVFDVASLTKALEGCWAAYYFVHSMNPQTADFAKADRSAAEAMIKAAEFAQLERIIYLSGLGEENSNLSKHLRSRAEVAKILQSGKVPVTILRAAMIIGSGSASFEILRYLVERLPIMVTPRWVDTPSQPIAIRNVLFYLIGCLEKDETTGKTFDIGGPEVVRYRDLMQLYTEEAGLKKRLIVPVPVFTPKLSSHWIHLVTPVPSFIARPLAEGLRNPCVCENDEIKTILPQELFTCRAAIALALNKIQHDQVESHWTDAGIVPPSEWATKDDATWAGGTIYEDKRRLVLDGKPEEIWMPIVSLGGSTGYYYGNWLWRLRGLMDSMIGGVGLRRGRRHPHELHPGDCLDFWRVKLVEPGKRLLLVAEMKLPGQALLEFRLQALGDGKTEVRQIARFLPTGLAGILYWFGISPLHDLVFDGMLKGIGDASGFKIAKGPEKIRHGA